EAAAERVGDENGGRRVGRDRPVERLHPLPPVRGLPVALLDPPVARVLALPVALPVLGTGIVEAREEEDTGGRAHKGLPTWTGVQSRSRHTGISLLCQGPILA